MEIDEIIQRLKEMSNPDAIEGMARYGITPGNTYGVSIPNLRKLARQIGKDHGLAVQLWKQNNRETRILASMIDDPARATEQQLDDWVKEFDYWEICDQCCMNLFEKTPYAYEKAAEWSARELEFVKRAGFVMMARLAVSDKKADDTRFTPFFPIMVREAGDHRNYVKKAVNWALRQIGKRNIGLNKQAIKVAETMNEQDSRSAQWIATDALRELKSDAVQKRLRRTHE